MTLRKLPDVRCMPLLVGLVQMLWSMIPLSQTPGFLFAQMLREFGIGQRWGLAMALAGLYLVFGALIKRRSSLTCALFLCACTWTVMSIMYFDSWYWYGDTPPWVTPITLTIPLFAAFLWFAFFREMMCQVVHINERRRCQR